KKLHQKLVALYPTAQVEQILPVKSSFTIENQPKQPSQRGLPSLTPSGRRFKVKPTTEEQVDKVLMLQTAIR
ncbi:hypothetical protein, partial [Thermococcus sp. GR4]|uniref:hypothetical protein n=1 Tax=Thermococcus sp. GR4 TaxID=1638254 RepID=UPI00197FC880